MLVMCRFGMMRVWVGACGLMSWKAITWSSWYATLAGIRPATISQNRQGMRELV